MEGKNKRSNKRFLDADVQEQQKISNTTAWRWKQKVVRNKTQKALHDCGISILSEPLAANYEQNLELNNNITVCNTVNEETDEKILAHNSLVNDLNEIPLTQRANICRQNEGQSEVMFEYSKITLEQVMYMIEAFSLKFHLTEEGKTALGKMCTILSGKPYLTMSNYFCAKLFDFDSLSVFNLHYYCGECCKSVLLSTRKKISTENMIHVVCKCCKKMSKLDINSQFYVTLDLDYQLQLLFSKDIFNMVTSNNARKSMEDKIISDVCDGSLYQKILNVNSPDILNKKVLTLNINIDGAPIFNSSKKSMWPIQAIINEIPVPERFRRIISCGYWILDHEPKAHEMQLFLKSFLKKNTDFNRNKGFIQVEGTMLKVFVMPLCFCVDSVARPILQNRMQFNGYYGCSWCYHRGEYINGSMRYPLEENTSSLRSHKQQLQDISIVVDLNKSIKGTKGPTVLTNIVPLFDCVWGFPLEYMHGVLLGATKYIWDLWYNSTKDKLFSLSLQDKKILDNRIIKIKPPLEINRLPRKLSDYKKFKASEWKSFMLYYGVPILENILDFSFLKHFSLFSNSVFILLQENISNEDLNKAELNLLQFVGEFEIFYGKKNLTFNLHSLLHLVDSVKRNGPLWANSAFPFESALRFFKRQINGAKGVELQVVKKFLEVQTLKSGTLKTANIDEICQDFIDQIYFKTKTTGYNGTVKTKLLGHENFKGYFKRCQINSSVYGSKLGTKLNSSRNNAYVELQSGEFARINYFFKENTNFLMSVDILKICPDFNTKYAVDHIFSIKKSDEVEIIQNISVSLIKSKCVLVDFHKPDCYYICKLPNHFEIQ